MFVLSMQIGTAKSARRMTMFYLSCFYNNNNGPNGHLFYVGGDLMMRRGMLPIIIFGIGKNMSAKNHHFQT